MESIGFGGATKDAIGSNGLNEFEMVRDQLNIAEGASSYNNFRAMGSPHDINGLNAEFKIFC